MALLFNAGTEKVEHGTGIEFGDPCTIIFWYNPNSVDTTAKTLVSQATSGNANEFFSSAASAGTGGGRLNITRATTNLSIASASSTFVANVWNYLAVVIDTSDSQHARFYRGDLATLATQTGYGTVTNGSGALTGQAGPFRIGSRTVDNFPCDADIATVMFWPNTALTLGQIQAQQFRPHVTAGCELFTHYGFNKVAAQPDWSGAGNNGTVGGSPTVVDHVPLGPPFGWDVVSEFVVVVGNTVTLTATAIGVPFFQMKVGKSLNSTAVGTPLFVKKVPKTLAATAIGIPAFATRVFTPISLVATAIGVATLNAVVTFRRTISATAVGVPSIQIKALKNLSATVVGIVKFVRKTSKTLSVLAGLHESVTLFYDFAGEGFAPRRGPHLTYSGGSNGTFFDASGVLQTSGTNSPRLDHDLSGNSLGLLVEEQRVWRALHNQDLGNPVWTKVDISAAKTATGLDGVANSASTVTAIEDNGTVLQTVTITSREMTVSVYVKRVTGSGDIDITDNNGTNWTTLTGLSSSVWTRHDITRTQANPVFGFRIVTNTDTIEVDFVGLEEGAYPTSPVEVGASTVTRTEDQISTTDLSWFDPLRGTFVVEAIAAPGLDSGGFIWSIEDADTPTVVIWASNVPGTGTLRTQHIPDAGTIFDKTIASVWTVGSTAKAAYGYEINNMRSAGGGTLSSLDTAGDPAATFVKFLVGSRANSGNAFTNHWNGHIKSARYYNVRRPDAFLANETGDSPENFVSFTKKIKKNLPVTATGIASLSARIVSVVTISATAVGVVKITRRVSKGISATAVGLANFRVTVGKTLRATAIGIPSLNFPGGAAAVAVVRWYKGLFGGPGKTAGR